MNLTHIWSVAFYESKTLFRSWFFRIFAIMALLILFGINMGLFGSHSDARWTFRAIAANMPYINVLFINVAQAVIAVFLASDFLKRDKKLDTTEVIYARPITNGEYVTGKTLGIIILFMSLVIMALGMSLIFNLLRKDVPIIWEAYLFYPLLIALPTLVYILGLSFFLMILLRSQAVTFLVLLGYIGLTLAYFRDKGYGMFDYMAFNLPMVYSDFIGFSDPLRIILHRLTYLLLGLGFIFATIRFLKRLPQTGRWNFLNLFLFIFFLASGLGAGSLYYSLFKKDSEQRQEYLSLNNRYAGMEVVDVTDNRIQVDQDRRSLQISSVIRYRNSSDRILDTLIFSLNPGFKIDSIMERSRPLEFRRLGPLILILPDRGVAPGRSGIVEFSYQGVADPSLAYLDIPEEQMEALKKAAVATIDKQPGIVHPEYMLLTPELIWYPIAGVGFNMLNFQPRGLDFARFSLIVRPDSGMSVIAPGKVDTTGNAVSFTPSDDLSVLPLIIAPLERRSRVIDEVEYKLYLAPGHDYFSGYFSEIGDTLDALIREQKDNYEIDELDLYYTFERVSLVEVPVQYHAYERPYIQSIENILPEIILLPEKGAGLNTLDFERFKQAEERNDRERENKRSTREIQVDQFKRFLQNTFFQSGYRTRGLYGRGGGGESITTYNQDLYTRNPYCVFPLYYNYVTGIRSPTYPVFNSMIELYLKEGFEVSPRQGFTGGITEKERANLALRGKSMIELFAEWDTELSSSLINQTGSFVISALKNRVGMSNFDNFLYYYLEDHAFQAITFEQFSEDFYREFGVRIAPYLEVIASGGGMATFMISEPEYIQTRDNIGDAYLVKFRISNVGDARGLVDVNFRIMGQGGFGGGGGMNEEKRLYEVDSGQTREVQAVMYDRPMMMTVNTLISGNIPSSYNHFLRSATQVDRVNQEEFDRVSDHRVSFRYEGEFVVDNEDAGFTSYSVSGASKLKQYFDSRREQKEGLQYSSLNEWWTPNTWTPVAHSAYYGETVRSAMVIRNGDGTNYARWSKCLPEKGVYEVYVYIPVSAMLKRPGRREQGGGSQGGSSQGRPQGQQNRRMGPEFADKGADYHYTLSSAEGSEERVLELNNPEDGWNRLGSFHFPADTAVITLSNETDGRRVIADAVKWVKKSP